MCERLYKGCCRLQKTIEAGSAGGAMLTQNGAVVWFKLQAIFATYTAEVEYIAAATATKAGLWVHKLLGEVHCRAWPELWQLHSLLVNHPARRVSREVSINSSPLDD
jgi:hypothetical protein